MAAHQRCYAIEAADPTIGARQGLEIGSGQHVGVEGTRRNGEGLQKILAREVRNFALGIPDPKIE